MRKRACQDGYKQWSVFTKISVSSGVSYSTLSARSHFNQVLKSSNIRRIAVLFTLLLPSHQAVKCNTNDHQHDYTGHKCHNNYSGILGIFASRGNCCRRILVQGGLERRLFTVAACVVNGKRTYNKTYFSS